MPILPGRCRTIINLFICVPVFILMFSFLDGVKAAGGPDYFRSLQKRLVADGFDPDVISRIYANPQVSFEAKGISVYFVHHESKVDYDQYTDPRQIQKAQKYLQKHRESFAMAEEVYGVDKEVVTAIMLVETQLGKLLGSRSVLNTLSTLAALSDPQVRELLWEKVADTPELTRSRFDDKAERKAQWAYRELRAYLKHAEAEGFDPAAVNGSFAGAMGIAQFMPSNIDTLAKDGNGDGRIDLFDDADAIASIAYYLKKHGWRPGIDRQKAEKVIYHYNHSDRYVNAILDISDLLKG